MATKYSAHDASGGGAGTILDPYTDQELFDNVDGSEDFSLQSDSPCLAAGIDGGIW